MYMVPFHSNNWLDDFGSEDLFDHLSKALDFSPKFNNIMSTDIIEKDGNYELIMDLPGIKKDNIKIKLQEGNLTISASSSSDKSTESKESGKTYVRKERSSGHYSRSFYVGKNVTEQDIKAKFENGILKITLPKNKPETEKPNTYISVE